MTDARKLIATRSIRGLADGVVSIALAQLRGTIGAVGDRQRCARPTGAGGGVEQSTRAGEGDEPHVAEVADQRVRPVLRVPDRLRRAVGCDEVELTDACSGRPPAAVPSQKHVSALLGRFGGAA